MWHERRRPVASPERFTEKRLADGAGEGVKPDTWTMMKERTSFRSFCNLRPNRMRMPSAMTRHHCL